MKIAYYNTVESGKLKIEIFRCGSCRQNLDPCVPSQRRTGGTGLCCFCTKLHNILYYNILHKIYEKMWENVRLFVLFRAFSCFCGQMWEPSEKAGVSLQKKRHTMRTIRNIVSKETAKLIPTTVDGRREFLKRSLKQYEGRNVYCNALQNEVMITGFSLEETIHHACSTRKSTIAALNIIESIKHCEFDRCALPHSNRQKRKFEIIYLFKANIENVGSVQVVIGATFVNGFIHYCLTCKEK